MPVRAVRLDVRVKIIKPSAAPERLISAVIYHKNRQVFCYSAEIILFTEIKLKYS